MPLPMSEERSSRIERPEPRGDVFAARAPAAHRAARRGARAGPRRRPRRAVRRLGGHDPQGPRSPSRARAASIRTHGGAIAGQPATGAERAFDVRERLQRAEKDAIGRAAAAHGRRRRDVALDASTTALAVARHLKARGGWSRLTVITNGLRIASELAGHPGITVAMPGGFVRWEALSVVGQLGEDVFRRSTSRRRSWARPGSRSSPA